MASNCNCPYKKFSYCDYPACLKRHKKGFKKSGRDFSKIVRGWRIIGELKIYFRSLWEINFAHVLQWHLETGTPLQGKTIIRWEYEPQTFIFHKIQSGTRAYKPDFKVYFAGGQADLFGNGFHEWFEVKGYMKPQDKTKLKRMAKYYPAEKVNVIDAAWFKANSMFYRSAVKNWEDHPDN